MRAQPGWRACSTCRNLRRTLYVRWCHFADRPWLAYESQKRIDELLPCERARRDEWEPRRRPRTVLTGFGWVRTVGGKSDMGGWWLGLGSTNPF